jgi:hypothetical protein
LGLVLGVVYPVENREEDGDRGVIRGVDFSDDLDEEFWRQLFAEIGDFQDTVGKTWIRRRHSTFK